MITLALNSISMATTQDELLGIPRQQNFTTLPDGEEAAGNTTTDEQSAQQPTASAGYEDGGIPEVAEATRKVTNAGMPNNPTSAKDVIKRGVLNVAAPVKQTPKPDNDGESPHNFWRDLYQQSTPFKRKSDNELKDEEKRARRRQLFSALGDTLSGIANLYYTSKGAPNAYDPTKNMSEITRDRYEKAKKDYEENAKQYMSGYMEAARLDQADELRDKEWNHRIEREELEDKRKEKADARAEAKAERDEEMSDLKMQLMAGKISYQDALTLKAQIDAKYEDQLKKSEIDKNNRVGTKTGSGGGQKATAMWQAVDSKGNIHEFPATSTAHAYGIATANGWTIGGKTSTSVTTKSGVGSNQTTKTVRTEGAGGSASGTKKPSPMASKTTGNGSGSKQKKRNPMKK
jgi:hypothetical protein